MRMMTVTAALPALNSVRALSLLKETKTASFYIKTVLSDEPNSMVEKGKESYEYYIMVILSAYPSALEDENFKGEWTTDEGATLISFQRSRPSRKGGKKWFEFTYEDVFSSIGSWFDRLNIDQLGDRWEEDRCLDNFSSDQAIQALEETVRFFKLKYKI